MSTQNRRIPKYRHHKGTGQAVVSIGGKEFYLGAFDTPPSRERYDRLIAEWLANGRLLHPFKQDQTTTITQLVAAFWTHAQSYYRNPDGTHTSSVANFRQALEPLVQIYGSSPAENFGPLALKAVREKMIEKNWCRTNINRHISRIKSVFKWAVENELIPPSIWEAISTVAGLKRGRSGARESEPVKPVPEAHIDAVQPFVSRQVWAMIQLQLLTAARPGEIVNLRPVDIDTSEEVWTCTPPDHKTAYHGHQRTIYMGPHAQDVVRPFLMGRAIDRALFSPKEAETERHAAAKTHRRPNQKPNPQISTRKVGNCYDANIYRRAIARACEAAGVPSWHPHQLRHNAATNIRRDFGIETARIILGHQSIDVTEIYAERDRAHAMTVINKVG